ncbi:cell wall protein [Nocardiopsis algeriensis]|uniref:LPXTG-motif cell wall-anchored protein n=1 Tax=Nocardiopsis algeriensis TaxID=1478215 RepID=A0A841IPS3_9ACTN|nr:cell wall protein [Nocardiopsis algeriensis]MBB6118331.1 hypothetical protein [Nocardiopsis algeriensis]
MKSTPKITARRILQGSAAFAALGAMSIATALPAAADTSAAGWAYAYVGYEQGVSATDVIPQGGSGGDSNSFQGSLDEFLSLSASTSASVNGNGASSTATVDSARIVLTADDVQAILDGLDEEDEEETEEDEEDKDEADEAEETEDGESDDAPDESSEADGDSTGGDDTGNGETDGGSTGGDDTGNGEADGGSTGGDDTGNGETDGEAGGDSGSTDGEADPTEEETAPADEVDAEAAVVDSTEDEVLALEEYELTDGGDAIVLDATLSGASVTTTYSWSGKVSHSFDPGSVSYSVNEFGANVEPFDVSEAWTSVELGYDWQDAYTGIMLGVDVPATDEADGFYGEYPLGVAYASYGLESVDAGGGEDKGDDKGDGKDEAENTRNTEELAKPEPKPTEAALATTGSPVAGLIAAGAAIAAGGGAAAYLARRKKNAVADSAEENSES